MTNENDLIRRGDAPYIRTGVKDRDGREICVGDRIMIDLSGPFTKTEYWRPEYEVVFKPPHFCIKHVGGDKDSSTADFYWRVPQKSSTEKIVTISIAALPAAAAEAENARLRDALEGWLELASHCTIEDGVCCCGDDMKNHANPMDCGHSPVDHGAYMARHLEEITRAALQPKETDHE
jgi:hypothetical protein